jgi:arginine N-succinyltransferase
MSYAEADLLSSENKDFIRDLFPSGVIYASLLSPEAQSVIGKVGPQTKGVEKMLRRVGFRYAERIDPFDGGPHFVAPAEEIAPVNETRRGKFAGVLDDAAPSSHGLIASEHGGAPFFRAVAGRFALTAEGLRLAAEAAEHLALVAGDDVTCLPLG